MNKKTNFTNADAKRILLFLKAINKYGFEHREQIKDVLHWVDFDDYNEEEVWNELDRTIKPI